ncbi:carbonic anhydrase [Karstenula rhodostoma CBS 690.94]|uniref:Carbonic anhydrase n=1 Tax=Karstenula rhodostoma CBS 690.94 TaxID=1392251 RepID=A0A9P4U7Y5_9PLEO|nr:carbonic anhydrase [Karstenula rhodostoma CBS 690.94]
MLFKSLLVVGTASASCLHGLYRRSEGEVEIPHFGYEDTFGPLNWAALAPENEACKAGKNQSPINIDSTVSLATEKPILDIPQQAVEFENLNTTIEVVVNGTTTFGGNQFSLAQFHIHTPSEHRINREYFPLEVHMVHKGVGHLPNKANTPTADPTQIVVLALMFEMCTQSSDPLIASIAPHLDAITEPGSRTPIETGIDFSGVLAVIESSNIFQYTGSLTTPPCSEGVTFLAVETPLKINVPDYNAIKKIVKYNSRLSQNTLGNDNIIAVAAASGGATAPNNETVVEEATPVEGAPVAGSTVVISEISGSPVAEPMVGLVQRGMRFRS